MAVDCQAVARLLNAYLDDELDRELAQQVAAHLDVCRRCGLQAEAYASLKQSIHDQVAAPPEAVQRLRAFAEALLAEDPVPSGQHREAAAEIDLRDDHR